jgi:MFS transporter, ACS family, D-galactonate transporter
MIEAAAVVGVGWYSASMASRGVPSRLSRGFLAAGLVCLSGLSLLLIIVLSAGVMRTGALILGFAAAQAVWPLLFALISEIAPASRRGSVISIFTAIFTTAGLISPALMGYAVQWAAVAGKGYQNGFLILGAFTAVGGLIGFWLINPERDQARRLQLRDFVVPAV